MNEDFTTRSASLLGDDGIKKLSNSCIAVFGIGGVGSHTIEALARSGVGTLIIVDSDTVRPSNINRQAVAYTDTVGMKKTDVMTAIIRRICPETRVLAYDCFILPENTEDFFRALPAAPDYIIDCIDTVSAKLSLISYAHGHDIPVISSMGTADKLHPEAFRISDISKTSVCPLCRVMRREIRERGLGRLTVLWSDEAPIRHDAADLGSVSFVPPAAGLMIAGYVIRDICGLK